MLLVRVVVRPNPIHGLGAIADEPIAQGTPVWRFTPGFDLCCDDARFINHANNPNLAPNASEDGYGVDIAVRDIKAGEELTIDYRVLQDASP